MHVNPRHNFRPSRSVGTVTTVTARSTPPSVMMLLRSARKWLAATLTEGDRNYVSGLVRRLNKEFDLLDFEGIPSLQRWRETGVTTRIFPALGDYPDRKPKPSYLVNDVITYDLSQCYNKRFETMGEAEGALLPLRRLFLDPKKWLHEKARKKLRGVALVKFLRTVNATFPSDDASARSKNLKLFYTRFYGLCTPRKARRDTQPVGALHDIGLAARIQNTLYVVKKELEFRRGFEGGDIVLMVQTDSITLRVGAVAQHEVYGELAIRGAVSSAAVPRPYDELLAEAMSTPGVAEWKVETKPTVAIFRGLAGKYAFMTTSVCACQGDQASLSV